MGVTSQFVECYLQGNIMRLDVIEQKIAENEMTAAQVFTQMRQHIISRNDVLDEALKQIDLCHRSFPDAPRVSLDEVVGALWRIKS